MAKKKTVGAKYFGKPLTDDPDDAPELLDDFFRYAELRHGEGNPSGRQHGVVQSQSVIAQRPRAKKPGAKPGAKSVNKPS
jgi:hypothetical protein